MEFEEVQKILNEHHKRMEQQCKGNPSNCDCEKCLKIKENGRWQYKK